MILAMLAAILHIADILFEKDHETDGVYIKHEEMMEIGECAVVVCMLCVMRVMLCVAVI